MVRRCFECGARTDVDQLMRVGDGEFCAQCFEALLRAGARAREEPERSAEPPRPEPPARSESRRRCLVCERVLTGVPAVVFLGGEICGACSAEMSSELAAAESVDASTSADGASTTASPSAHAAVGQAAGYPKRERDTATFTPGAGIAECAGCERPMPGPGSYRVLHGKRYCAACWPVFSRLPAAVLERPASSGESGSASAVESGARTSPPDAAACACCARPLDEGAQSRQGFRLCAACASSDLELALSVARARHRRELRRLGSALEEDR